MINIGAVLGLLPITGVPLPLVSYGGSSLIPTLVALGMLMAFAKAEPDARRALRRKSTAAVTATALTCTSSSRRAGRAATSNRR